MSYEALHDTIKQGRDVSFIFKDALWSDPNTMKEIFSNFRTIGKGTNGTVYFLPSAVVNTYFQNIGDNNVAIKRIEVENIKKKFSKECLSGGDYVLSKPIAEIVNSVVYTELLDSEKSPHFMRFFCAFGFHNSVYLVYEFCGYRMKNGLYCSVTLSKLPSVLKGRPLNKKIVMEICFVILHTIWKMQEFGIVHYDLKPDNILIQPITKKTTFRGVYLENVDYFCYEIDVSRKKKKFFVKNRGYLLKIGDYGVTTTYTYPAGQNRKKIIPKNIQKEGETKRILEEKFGITGKYSKSYDHRFFLPQLWFLCEYWKIAPPSFLNKIIKDYNIKISQEYNRPIMPDIDEKGVDDILSETGWNKYLLSDANFDVEKKSFLCI